MRAQYRIRRALLRDLDRILAIENASFGREAYDRNLFAYYFYNSAGLFLVAERRGAICGYAVSYVRGKSPSLRAELISIAVDPARREKGCASALLDSTLRRLRIRRVLRLHLVVRLNNRPARMLYEKYGFRTLRRVPGYYQDGGDGIAMTLLLQ